eukprot:TRINITY_DN25713_c0_g1_i1.p1 TRINITY_DN25713_c0_g1~~TRINITY_DN25713_c0_g1_i1.p1  ORF type:complete len:139 (-),score=36.56 TRINITY_DN25713_c0_g1_i1:50-427(-)
MQHMTLLLLLCTTTTVAAFFAISNQHLRRPTSMALQHSKQAVSEHDLDHTREEENAKLAAYLQQLQSRDQIIAWAEDEMQAEEVRQQEQELAACSLYITQRLLQLNIEEAAMQRRTSAAADDTFA